MKRLIFCATCLCFLTTMKLAAQASAASGPNPAEVTTRRQALPSPASIRPSVAARPSTAEAGPAHAGWKPLHELPSLALVDRNGHAATLASGASRHWFVFYRTVACVPCDRLMLALQASTSKELKAGKPYTIIVDSPDRDGLETVHAGFQGLSDATWTADRHKAVATTLQLRGAPILIAMDGDRVAWRVAGSLDSTQTIVHMADAWLAQNAATTSQAPAVSWGQAKQGSSRNELPGVE